MPRTFDRRTPARDYDPLANLLNYQDIDKSILKYGESFDNRLADAWAGFLDDLSRKFQDDPSKAQNFVQNIIGRFVPLLNPLFGNEEQDNLLAAGTFTDAASLAAMAGWSWNEVNGHTDWGSAEFDASGVAAGLVSNEVAVAADQLLDASVWMEWEDVAASGVAFQLDLSLYNDGDYVSTVTLASTSSPAADQVWTKLSPSTVYTVPDGVTHVRLRLGVTAAVTAGTVRFDDAFLAKTTRLQKASQRVIDGIVNGFLGLLGISGHDADRVGDAVQAQADTTVGTTAQMVQVLAALGDGTPDADDFERLNLLTLGSNWSTYQTGGGTLSTSNGHDAHFAGTGDAEFVTYKNNVVALTDNQTSTIVLGSSPEFVPIIGTPAEFGYNSIWLRCTSFSSWATRTGLRCMFGADLTLAIWWFLNGTGILLTNASAAPLSATLSALPTKGAVFEFTAGMVGQPLRMIARINGTPIIDDIATASTYGSTQRRRGFGGQSNTALLLGTAHPGDVKQWTAQG